MNIFSHSRHGAGVPDGRHQSRVKGHNGPFVVTYEYNAGYAARHTAYTLLTSRRRKQQTKKKNNKYHSTILNLCDPDNLSTYLTTKPTAGIHFALCEWVCVQVQFPPPLKWIYFDIRGLVFLALFGFYGCFELSRSPSTYHPPQLLISISRVCVYHSHPHPPCGIC